MCNLYNNGFTTYEIADIVKLAYGSICRYLNNGKTFGFCDYNGFDDKKIKIICITTGETFNSITQAGKAYNTSPSHVCSCCKGNRKYSGIHPISGKPLCWEYYNN